ncbi:MAG: DsrE family protein [Saprospiraceae bacterium]|nr:DsrE family protein [Saprospiraceae bacterium]
MKHLFIIILTFFVQSTIVAQIKTEKGKSHNHKIVFQMVSKDTADHAALIRQIKNILNLEPHCKVEVVCHGPGINILMKEKTTVLLKIIELSLNKVDFVACEFTMSQKNIVRTDLIDVCRTVPGGILEIVYKQEKGWSYIKSGY